MSSVEREGGALVDGVASRRRERSPPHTADEICRVCRSEGTRDSPLFYPCLCSGSIKFVHQECLVQWLKHSRKTFCELCQHPFTFRPIYAENMPDRLPLFVLAKAMLKKAHHVLTDVVRYLVVALVWLLLVPYLTYHLWKLYFGEIGWHQSMSWPRSWVTDCVEGGVLSLVIIGVFLCFVGLRDYLVLYGAQPEGRVADAPQTGEGRRRSSRGILRHFRARQRVEVAAFTGLDRIVLGTTESATPTPTAEEVPDTNRVGVDDQRDATFPEGIATTENERNTITVEEISLDQLLGLKGPWSMLAENIIWVILFNLTFLGLFAFLPYHIGRITTRLLNKSLRMVLETSVVREMFWFRWASGHLVMLAIHSIKKPLFVEKTVMIMIGYSMIATLLSRYLALEGIQRWAYKHHISRMVHFLVTLFYVFFKVSALLIFEVGMFPVFCGFVLDMATLRLFDATWSSRMQLLGRSPTLGIFLHWVVGLSFMIHFSNFIRMLRDILRPGALWFLRNQNDPDYNAMKEMIDISGGKHFFRLCISLGMYGVIILATFGAPLAMVTRIVPGLLPLRWSAIDPFPEMPFDLLLFHVVLPVALKRLPLKRLARSLLKRWFVFSCHLLCLSSYILDIRQSDEETTAGTVVELSAHGRIRPQIYRSNPAIIRTLPSQRSSLTTTVYKPPSFGLRIVCLIALTWVAISLVLVILLLVPIYTGRIIFWRTIGLEVHDAYSFCVGLYAACLIAHNLHDFIKDLWLPIGDASRRHNLPSMMFRSCRNMLVAGLFVVLIIPALLGILFDLTVMQPMRTILHESPVMLFLQDWALGLFFCKIARRVLIHSPESPLRQGVIDLRDQSWHAVSIQSVFFNLFLPVTMSLIALIGVPFLISRYVFFILSFYFASKEQILLEIRYFLEHFCYSSTFFAYSLYWWGYHLRQGAVHLLRSVRDDEYLIGRQLRNLERDELSTRL